MSLTRRKADAKGRVILPDQFVGQVVSVDLVSDSEVRIRLVRRPRGRPSLAALLSGVTRKNRPEKVDFGPSVGDELL